MRHFRATYLLMAMLAFILISSGSHALERNVAGQGAYIYAFDSSAAPLVGDAANITCYISIDGGTSATLTASISEIGGGSYYTTFTLAETDGGHISLVSVSSTVGATVGAVAWDTVPAIVDANIVSIFGSATAALNLLYQFDGVTGLVGSLFPSYQAQVSGTASGSSTISTVADSGTANTGVVNAGDYTDTHSLDGGYWEIEQSGTALQVTMTFNVGPTGIPSEIVLDGRLYDPPATVPDILDVEVYNYITTTWQGVGVITGVNSTDDQVHPFRLTNQQVDRVTDPGEVSIRFTNQGAFGNNTEFFIDRVTCGYAVVASAVGYQNAAVWVSDNGTTGTQLNVDGV